MGTRPQVVGTHRPALRCVDKLPPRGEGQMDYGTLLLIAQWKKAAKDNPTDPVAAMVKKER